jgi:FAD/FMN-containing dehydrogenase
MIPDSHYDRAALETMTGSLRGFRGELLLPGGARYEKARRVHNGMIDKRPALIARCRGAADIARAVGVARDAGIELSVKGGGHNVAGRAVTDGGLMIDLSGMRSVSVDAKARTARAEGGATWGDVDRATQRHGLAVTGGMISTTGIGGLTLGGGLGWLMGRYGLTVDNLLSAEVVTADGATLVASETTEPDLFWAIRGGGGNFGVVSWFEYRLHPVGPVVTGVQMAYPFAAAVEVLELYRELTADGPDDLTVNAGLLHAPDGSGDKVAVIGGCHIGPATQAERDLEPLRSFGSPVVANLGPMEYTAVNSLLDAAYPRGALNYWKSSFLRDLSDDAIETIVAAFADCPSPMTAFVLENLHGEVTRVPVAATAVPHREHGYNFLITSVWANPQATERNVDWTRAAFQAVAPHTTARRYVNYIADDEVGDGPVREAYGENYARLVEAKGRYDPTNLFRLNQNIPPPRAAGS